MKKPIDIDPTVPVVIVLIIVWAAIIFSCPGCSPAYTGKISVSEENEYIVIGREVEGGPTIKEKYVHDGIGWKLIPDTMEIK